MNLILGVEMAGRSKNATPKFFPRVFSELLYKEIWGGGRKRMIFFLEKCAEWWEKSRKFEKIGGNLFFPWNTKVAINFQPETLATN